MKTIVTIICSLFLIVGCKKGEKQDQDTAGDLTKIEAEFIYIQDAAVLKGQSFIYGVVLDDKAKELADKVTPMKSDQYDMVPVVVNGVVKPNPQKDGWKEVVEIKEIIEVLPVNNKDTSQTIKVDVN